MKTSLTIENGWVIIRRNGLYGEYANKTTDYWIILCHDQCTNDFQIGQKNKGHDLAIWRQHLPNWCPRCYKSLPDVPAARTIQNYFTLYDLAELNINI